jgi:nicotinate-nucleotide adenylyltransferase
LHLSDAIRWAGPGVRQSAAAPLTAKPAAAKLGALTADSVSPDRPRWGVLGGTFDPPHLGHFALAQSAATELELERVLWVPSGNPPHKKGKVLSSFADRATMTEMTARRDRRFDVSRIEATLPGESYTVKTLAHLGQALPEMHLYFIVGADVLPELSDWYHPERISRWATLACGLRPGYSRPDPAGLPVDRVVYFQGPELEVSSSEIRRRIADGLSFEDLVSPDVARYIRDHSLYSSS